MRACEQASPPGVGQSRSGIVRHRHNLGKASPRNTCGVCHSLLPIGITLEPEDGEHLIDAIHHPGTIAVQDLVIGKVGGDDGREFPVITVGYQILDGCVICTIALASLRFRAELVQEKVLRP